MSFFAICSITRRSKNLSPKSVSKSFNHMKGAGRKVLNSFDLDSIAVPEFIVLSTVKLKRLFLKIVKYYELYIY